MKIRALILIGCAAILCGCDYEGYEKVSSGPLTEPVEVTEVIFSPSRHGDGMGVGMGFSGRGNMVTTVTPITVDIPEKHSVVFMCTHGKFIVEDRELWSALKVGDKGEAEYVELYKVKKKDGIEVERRLYSYHLLNVVINGKRTLSKNR